MNTHTAAFTVFGGSYVQEAHGFSPSRRPTTGLAVWGFVLASLLFGVAAIATVTVTYAQGVLS